jgi:hypothetical protein
MIKINATEVNDAMVLVSTVLPQAMAAYSILKLIWLRTNPGKTEADYLGYLLAASQTNVDETAALLTADGYVETSPGNWSKK